MGVCMIGMCMFRVRVTRLSNIVLLVMGVLCSIFLWGYFIWLLVVMSRIVCGEGVYVYDVLGWCYFDGLLGLFIV